MKKIIVLLVAFCLFSCTKKKNESIYGNWYFDEVVDYESTKTKFPKIILENEFASYYNFEILNDSILDFKPGFFYEINNNFKITDEDIRHKKSHFYLGTKTNYKLDKKGFVFYNKTIKDWDTIKIIKVSKDTMIVNGFENAKYRLIRKPKIKKNFSSYDAIVVERSPCYGSCPFNSTYIDKEGYFFFKGYNSNTQDYNFSARLNKNQIQYYFNLFEKYNINKKEIKIPLRVSDLQNNVVSFFKNGKLIKSISCSLNPPIDLDKAYTELSFAYQTLPVLQDFNFIFEQKVNYFTFRNKSKTLKLSESQGFYLEVAFRKGKESNKKINLDYNLEYNDWNEKSKIKNIYTDGRYYQINYKDNTSKTIDIGYNFVENNPIIKQKKRE